MKTLVITSTVIFIAMIFYVIASSIINLYLQHRLIFKEKKANPDNPPLDIASTPESPSEDNLIALSKKLIGTCYVKKSFAPVFYLRIVRVSGPAENDEMLCTATCVDLYHSNSLGTLTFPIRQLETDYNRISIPEYLEAGEMMYNNFLSENKRLDDVYKSNNL
jgi:hypothetical protein